jgi:hypothetical protein
VSQQDGPPYTVPPDFFNDVKKLSVPMFISEELLMDYGVIPDTREHKPISRRTRIRWWFADKRDYFAAWVYKVLAGHELPDDGLHEPPG